jgi:hypothetical protein
MLKTEVDKSSFFHGEIHMLMQQLQHDTREYTYCPLPVKENN